MGMLDIVWFIIVMGVVLMGYLLFGNRRFGANVEGLKGIANSVRYCFQMFLGHFNYMELKQISSYDAMFFFFSFQIIFKFFVINVLLAIVDKNFRAEDAVRHKAEELL